MFTSQYSICAWVQSGHDSFASSPLLFASLSCKMKGMMGARHMKRIDITRELLTAPVYPGDPEPRLEAMSRIELGDVCNTSLLHACLHTGTHLDAPRILSPRGRTPSRRCWRPAWETARWWPSTGCCWAPGGGAAGPGPQAAAVQGKNPDQPQRGVRAVGCGLPPGGGGGSVGVPG